MWRLRHGDTEWTEAGRHTGRGDIPLSVEGRRQARQAARLLGGKTLRALAARWLGCDVASGTVLPMDPAAVRSRARAGGAGSEALERDSERVGGSARRLTVARRGRGRHYWCA
jgi:broad specificity phosphatase PhoE